MLGHYTPKRPSDFFVRRMAEINRDLNQKEGENIPNPYRIALPSINRIINKTEELIYLMIILTSRNSLLKAWPKADVLAWKMVENRATRR